MRYEYTLTWEGVAPDKAADERRTQLQTYFSKLQASITPALDARVPGLSANLWLAVGQLVEFGYIAGMGERTTTHKADLRAALDETMRRLDAGK